MSLSWNMMAFSLLVAIDLSSLRAKDTRPKFRLLRLLLYIAFEICCSLLQVAMSCLASGGVLEVPPTHIYLDSISLLLNVDAGKYFDLWTESLAMAKQRHAVLEETAITLQDHNTRLERRLTQEQRKTSQVQIEVQRLRHRETELARLKSRVRVIQIKGAFVLIKFLRILTSQKAFFRRHIEDDQQFRLGLARGLVKFADHTSQLEDSNICLQQQLLDVEAMYDASTSTVLELRSRLEESIASRKNAAREFLMYRIKMKTRRDTRERKFLMALMVLWRLAFYFSRQAQGFYTQAHNMGQLLAMVTSQRRGLSRMLDSSRAECNQLVVKQKELVRQADAQAAEQESSTRSAGIAMALLHQFLTQMCEQCEILIDLVDVQEVEHELDTRSAGIAIALLSRSLTQSRVQGQELVRRYKSLKTTHETTITKHKRLFLRVRTAEESVVSLSKELGVARRSSGLAVASLFLELQKKRTVEEKLSAKLQKINTLLADLLTNISKRTPVLKQGPTFELARIVERCASPLSVEDEFLSCSGTNTSDGSEGVTIMDDNDVVDGIANGVAPLTMTEKHIELLQYTFGQSYPNVNRDAHSFPATSNINTTTRATTSGVSIPMDRSQTIILHSPQHPPQRLPSYPAWPLTDAVTPPPLRRTPVLQFTPAGYKKQTHFAPFTPDTTPPHVAALYPPLAHSTPPRTSVVYNPPGRVPS
ncbi:hypothetical protein JAAARDRAFT_209524 [Jaapia argillacea MUCL 33604]|uniref:Uncharacterized protein n=1 Tax=Jaapia argillacea MUCL 33604 TaxID=933084 RepID=A0A067PUM0_9AGAM|nr:hypothetical protein JAAARDRAFT_209524 [Jaapia argillacea MUCL 33604]